MSVKNVGKKILVVDDETAVLHLMKVFLEDEGFEVVICNNPLDISRLMKQEKIDAVVCDFLMPHKNGLECIQTIRQEYGRELPIIMSTAVLNMDLEKVQSAGGTHLINKPVDFYNLIELLDAELSKIHDKKICVNAAIFMEGRSDKRLIKWAQFSDEIFRFEIPRELCSLDVQYFFEVVLKLPEEEIHLPFKGMITEILQMDMNQDLISVEIKVCDRTALERFKKAYEEQCKNIA